MTDAQTDRLLKTVLVRYLEQKTGMDRVQILNAILAFARDEEIIAFDADHAELVGNHLYRALTADIA